ncbi:Rhodanese-like domain-containing protein [Panaeolus papilionaceus]|nr:Rhodanese-like domain-containing protein [Panaeolus papilionaceus]
MTQTTRYMNRDELAELMKSDKVAKKDFVVVDVRDDDFVGGNVKGCVNQPASDFLMTVDGLVAKTKDVPVVIFHCALSQVRGPKAARVYAETRRNILDKDIDHEVVVLRDGFTEFQAKYRNDPDLVENWDKDFWVD